MKGYRGNVAGGSEWGDWGDVSHEGAKWAVRAKPGSGGWTNLKISVVGSAARKANYWIAWNGERFARNRDLAALKAHRPCLLALVQGHLEVIA